MRRVESQADCAFCGREFIRTNPARRCCGYECAGKLGKHVANGEPLQPSDVCLSPAGSIERIEAYRQRLERNEAIFSDLDSKTIAAPEDIGKTACFKRRSERNRKPAIREVQLG